MRTKNLNLKKKIAFIASVAMIATSTAAYLPFEANAANLIGTGYTTAVKNTAVDPAAKDTVQTFDILVKVNGKYLAQNDTTANGPKQYKLYESLEAAENDNYILTTMDDATWTQADTDTLLHSTAKTFANYTYNENATQYNVLTAAATNELELPYFEDANPEIELEFVAKKGATLSSRSVTSIKVKLDDNGVAKLPEQKSYVIGYSDDSNYSEKEEDFVDEKGDILADANTYATGSYEVLDLSGLQIRMGATNGKATGTYGASNADSLVDYKSFDYRKAEVVSPAKAIAANDTIATANAYPTDEDKITPLSYEIKKFGNKYAKVLTATLDTAVAPGASIKVQTGYYKSTWSASSNVATDGTVTLTMEGNGYAKSELVTFTKDGVSEYYMYVIKNATSVEETAEWEAKLTNVANLTNAPLGTAGVLNEQGRYKVTKKLVSESFADNTISDKDGITPAKVDAKNQTNLTTDVKVNATKDNAPSMAGVVATGEKAFKKDGTAATGTDKYWYFTDAEVDEIVKNLKKSQKRYITEYTIYNNEVDLSTEYSSSETAGLHYITVALKNKAIGLTDSSASKGAALFGKTGLSDGALLIGSSQGTAIDAATGKEVTIAKTDAGTATSDIIRTSTGHYIRFVFTTDYKIKYNNNNVDSDTVLGYDGKVAVEGRTITQPEIPENKGYAFKGWDVHFIENDAKNTWDTPNSEKNVDKYDGYYPQKMDGGNKVKNGDAITVKQAFSAASATEQINKDKDQITPNTYLVANYKGLRYKVMLHAGDGYLVTNKDASEATFGKYFGESLAKTAEMNLSDIGGGDFTKLTAQVAKREGYRVKGWTTEEGGTTALTAKTFQDAFPGENQTLDLYPVYEATKVTPSFKVFTFTAGKQDPTDGKYDTVKTAYTGATTADINNATVEFKMGEKLGTLPTPKLKGYTFNGWYVQKNGTTNVNAEKVTENSILDESIVNTRTDGTMGTNNADVDSSASITLYAKFTQNEYSVNYDLGDGDWFGVTNYNKSNSKKIVSYKVDNEGAVTYFNGDGSKVEGADIFGVNPQIGSGEFKKFTGWTINDDTKKYTTGTALATAIKNMDEASDLTLKATYKVNEDATRASIVLDGNADDAEFYAYASEDKDTDKAKGQFLSTGSRTLPGVETPDTKVSTVWEVKGSQIGTVGNTTGYLVARPGYTFKGWYADKECTTPYTFDVFPAKGVETIVYAKWEAAKSTKYTVNFNLINKNKSFVAKSDNDGFDSSEDSDFTFSATYGGETGSTIKAADKSFEVNGKKYNFSTKDSAGLDTEKELKAYYRDGYAKGAIILEDSICPDVADTNTSFFNAIKAQYTFTGTNKDAATNYKTLDPEDQALIDNSEGVIWVKKSNVEDKDIPSLYKSNEYTHKTTGAKTGLNTGAFVIDPEHFTTIQGNYVEDYVDEPEQPEEKELQAATDVKVAGGVVTWKAAKGAASYRYKVIDKNGNVKYAAATVKGTSQTLAAADIPADDYKIAVIAIAKDGKTTKTTEPIEVKVAKTNLTAPTDVKWADGVLTWKASTDAHHYNVKKVYTNGNVKYVGGTADATLDLAAESVDFTAYVIAVDANGKTATSTKGAKVAADTKKVLGVVTDAKYDAETNTVSWTAADNAKSYNICKMVNGKKFWVTGVKDTSYKFENKTPAFNYYVVAVAEDGDYTIGTFNAYPTMATDVVVTEGSKNVTWKAAEGAKYYKIGKVSADGKKVVWNNNKIEGTKGTFSYACTAGQKVVVMAVFKDEAKNLQTTRSATVVAAAAKADK